MNLEAKLVFEISVNCGNAIIIGDTPKGFSKVVPIIGGSFSGDNIKGEVISGGADWNCKKDNIIHVFAKYTLKTHDNVFISIENEGHIDTEDSQAVIKTVPKFEVQKGCGYDWLLSGIFVGTLMRKVCDEWIMEIKIYKLK